MSNVITISRDADTARLTAHDLVRRQLMRRGVSASGVPCYEVYETVVRQLAGTSPDRLGHLGFSPVPNDPHWVRVVCGEGPAAVVSRLRAFSQRVA